MPLSLTTTYNLETTTMKRNHMPHPSSQEHFFERLDHTVASRLVKWIFILVVALLFLLPVYDLFTGNWSDKIWTRLVVTTLLLVYVFVIIYIEGRWSETKHNMELPWWVIAGLVLLVASCIISFCCDFFWEEITHPYWIVSVVAMLVLLIVIVGSLLAYMKKK